MYLLCIVFANQRTLADIEDSFFGIFANFPSKTLSLAMRGVAFPTGRCYSPPADTLTQEVSQLMSTDTSVSVNTVLYSVYPSVFCFSNSVFSRKQEIPYTVESAPYVYNRIDEIRVNGQSFDVRECRLFERSEL